MCRQRARSARGMEGRSEKITSPTSLACFSRSSAPVRFLDTERQGLTNIASVEMPQLLSSLFFCFLGHLIGPVVCHSFCNFMGFPQVEQVPSSKFPRRKFYQVLCIQLKLTRQNQLNDTVLLKLENFAMNYASCSFRAAVYPFSFPSN